MKSLKVISALLLSVLMVSCLKDGESTSKEDFSGYCFNYVSDMNNDKAEVTVGGTYLFEVNYTDGVATVTMGNLKLNGSQSVSLQLENLAYKFDDKGGFVIDQPVVVSSYNGQHHTVSDFSFRLYRRYVGTYYFPAMWMTFVVDSQYRVRVIYTPSVYLGTTNVVNPDNGLFTSTDPYYVVAIDPTKSKAALHVLGAKFADRMPAMDMIFPDLPITCNMNTFTIEADEIVPRIGSVEYPSFKITNLKVSGNYELGMKVEFDCTIDTPSMKGTYKVSSDLQLLPAVETEK